MRFYTLRESNHGAAYLRNTLWLFSVLLQSLSPNSPKFVSFTLVSNNSQAKAKPPPTLLTTSRTTSLSMPVFLTDPCRQRRSHRQVFTPRQCVKSTTRHPVTILVSPFRLMKGDLGSDGTTDRLWGLGGRPFRLRLLLEGSSRSRCVRVTAVIKLSFRNPVCCVMILITVFS